MKATRDTALLMQRSIVQLLRNPIWLIVGFSTPILYLALFTPLLNHLAGAPGLPHGNVMEIFLPGILALLAYASGTGPGFSTLFELRAGVIERFRVTPATVPPTPTTASAPTASTTPGSSPSGTTESSTTSASAGPTPGPSSCCSSRTCTSSWLRIR